MKALVPLLAMLLVAGKAGNAERGKWERPTHSAHLLISPFTPDHARGILTAAIQAPEKKYGGKIALPGISGGALLRANHLLLVSDTGVGLTRVDNALARLSSGTVTPRQDEVLEPLPPGKVELEDLEDAAWDGARDLYVITSHSRTARGDSPESRYRLARLRFDATGKLLETRQSDALLQAIVNHLPFLADSIRRTPARTGLNIEGLAWDPQGQLLLGLRAPTITESTPRAHGGQEDAVVLRLKNPDQLFTQPGQPAVLGEVVKLDLHGQGIRGMAYDPRLKATWIVSGLSAEPGHPVTSPWRLWLWKGEGAPQPAKLPAGLALEQPETVTPVELDGLPFLLLIDPGRTASEYALIPTPECQN